MFPLIECALMPQSLHLGTFSNQKDSSPQGEFLSEMFSSCFEEMSNQADTFNKWTESKQIWAKQILKVLKH